VLSRWTQSVDASVSYMGDVRFESCLGY